MRNKQAGDGGGGMDERSLPRGGGGSGKLNPCGAGAGADAGGGGGGGCGADVDGRGGGRGDDSNSDRNRPEGFVWREAQEGSEVAPVAAAATARAGVGAGKKSTRRAD